MELLKTYIDCFRTGDAARLASLFIEDGVLYDDAAVKVGNDPIVVKGRDNIEAFFSQLFRHGGRKVSNILINGNAMRYDVDVAHMVILCLGVMKEEGNQIKEYRVMAV